ncbi:MAG: hypothetical protein ACREA9_17455 [Pyrinomonadaceae bacterium]
MSYIPIQGPFTTDRLASTMREPKAYAVCMPELVGGDTYMSEVGHAGSDGRTLCGLRVRLAKPNWRLADSRDGVSCNRCRKILHLEPCTDDKRR